MSRTVVQSLLAGIALSGAAYVASTWYVGTRIEATLGDAYARLGDNPVLRVVHREYRRGLFSATETLTIAPPAAPAGEEPGADESRPAGAKGGTGKPAGITLRTEIRHGPFPGGSTLAAGIAVTRFVLDEADRKAADTLFGGREPMEMRTVLDFAGGGHTRVTSPEVTVFKPDPHKGATTFKWGGLTLEASFAPELASYTYRLDAPRLLIDSGRSGSVTLSGLNASGNGQKGAGGQTLPGDSAQRFAVARIDVVPDPERSAPVVVQDFAYEASLTNRDGFLDLVARIGAATLRHGASEFGPARYDFALRHLHAQSFAEIYQLASRLSADPAQKAALDRNPPLLLAMAGKPMLEILKQGPEFQLERLSFNSPHGKTEVSGSLRIAPLDDADLARPNGLLAKLDGNLRLQLPEALAGSADGALAARLARAIEFGLLTRDSGVLQLDLAVRGGQVTANGVPFVPGMLDEEPPANGF